MPFVNVKVAGQPLAPSQITSIQAGVTALMTDILRKVGPLVGVLVEEVPLAGFTLYNEFTASDVDYFQKFFDVFTERKIFSRAVPVKPLLYTA